MEWQAALLSRLRAAVGVTSLIGTKSYIEEAPQNIARPYVTLLDVTGFRPQHLGGYDLEPSRVQVDVWTDGIKEKTTIMEAVLAALVPAHTTGGHKFQRADIALGPRDMPSERVGDQTVRRKSADLIIHHSTA